MKPSTKTLFLNSLLAFVSAFLLTTFLHEAGHFISYKFFGAQTTLYHNYVQTTGSDIGLWGRIISSLAGPLTSLAQGLIFLMLLKRIQSGASIHLLTLWMMFLGFVNFFGYLMLTPLSTSGDTGKVASLLGIPSWVSICIAIAGLAILLWIVFQQSHQIARFLPSETDLKIRSRYVNAILLFPVMMGSVINAALAFPIPVWLSLLYPLTSSYVLLWGYGRVLEAQPLKDATSELWTTIRPELAAITVTMILINRLLVSGFSF